MMTDPNHPLTLLELVGVLGLFVLACYLLTVLDRWWFQRWRARRPRP